MRKQNSTATSTTLRVYHISQITLSQKDIWWNKPTYLGAASLDLSKLHLNKFHYEAMKPLFDTKDRVMYRDNDSLFYEIARRMTYTKILHSWNI